MQCHQIEPHLPDYVNRCLPGYRLAWVAQHLAGCERCRTLTAALTQVPVAGSEPSPAGATEPVSSGLQRRVPAWVRPAVALFALVLLAGAVLALQVASRRAAEWRDSAVAGEPPAVLVARPDPESLRGRSTGPSQQLGSIQLSLESVAVEEGMVEARVHFRGQGLSLPVPDAWLSVRDGQRQEVDSEVAGITVDGAGIHVVAKFALPPGESRFLLRFGGVSQINRQRWLLFLPDPAETLGSDEGIAMAGSPSGARLLHFGMEGDLLQVHLRMPPVYDVAATPTFQLRDGEGNLFTTAKFTERQGFGSRELVLYFPVPREIHTPLTLIGSVPVRTQIGPWLLEADVIK